MTFRFCQIVFLTALLSSVVSADETSDLGRGKVIYLEKCAACHGREGQGVEGAYDSALKGDLAFDQLVSYVNETMPEDAPDTCVGEDAELVTRYFMDAFYTHEARQRNNPPEIEFARLTVDQYHNAVIDSMAVILGEHWPSEKRGLKARYFPKGRQFSRQELFSRIDWNIDFDFGAEIPAYHPGFEDKSEFSVEWSGGLTAPETGTYDIFVRSDNGFRVYLNQTPWAHEALIDNWVDANEGEYRASINLRAGRIYPLTIQMMKYQEPSANIHLEWKTPGGVRCVIPGSQLSPEHFPYVVNLQTEFPPDDRSIGYERGGAVSAEWDRATTLAAVEVLEFIRQHSDSIEGRKRRDYREAYRESEKPGMGSDEQLYRVLATKFISSAFRRSPTEREKDFFIDRSFRLSDAPETGFERVVLLSLKSPQFLYLPRFDALPDAYDVATRLSMTLYDSLPDGELVNAAKAGSLCDRDSIRKHAERLLYDPRTRVKVGNFFNQWLETDRAGMGTKDAKEFPGFDDQLVSSLRRSLGLMIENVVWSEDSDFRKLLTSDAFYVDRKLAEFYGLAGEDDSFESLGTHASFRPFRFEANHRSGFLTHPFLMAGFSYHRNTSPIHRGVFVAKRILGRTLKSPPVEVEPLEEDFDPTMTTRQRVAHQTKGTMCQSCHSIINPLGFGLENFDAAGRYRKTEKSQAIDATAEYISPEGKTYRWTNANELAQFLVKNEDVHRNFIEQLFQFMAKQPLAAYGPDLENELVNEFWESGFNIKNLIVEMAVVVALHKLESGE